MAQITPIRSVPNKTIPVDSTGGQQTDGPGAESGSKSSSGSVAAAVGGVTGSLTTVGIVGVIFVIRVRKRRRHQHHKADRDEVVEQNSHRPPLTPFYLNSTADSDRAGHGQGHIHFRQPLDMTAGFAGVGAGDVGAREGLPMSPSSTKASRRMTTPTRPRQSTSSVVMLSDVGSQMGSASSRDPRFPGGWVSATDVLGLRAEMENLRREMQEIRAERLEPPPEYAEE